MFEADALGLMILIVFLLALIVIAINTYLINRTLNRLLFPDGPPAFLKACPHCRRQMPARAVVCAFCNRESEPWTFQDGYWWRTGETGSREYLDVTSRRWVEQPSKT